MRNRIGLEALTQRGRSPFYNDLVSLIQESFNAVSELPNASNGDITLTLKSIKFKERMKTLVIKYMGVSLDKVVVTESAVVNLMCMMEFTKDSNKRLTKLEVSPGMMMEEMNRLYNDKTGYLDKPDTPTNLPFVFSLFVYTSLWRIKNPDGSFYFTPEEIAAGIMHEFGHVDHFIRASFRTYGRVLDAGDIISYIQVHPDKELILTLIANIKKSKYLDKEFKKIIEVTEKYFKTSNSLDDPYYLEALSTLCAVVVAQESAHQLFMFNNLLGGARDRVATNVQAVDAERSADEFAARQGAYQPLVSMVGKLYDASENKADLAFRQFMWSGPAIIFGLMNHFMSVFNLAPEQVTNGYDPVLRRLELIVETAKHAFHDVDLPEEVKAELRSQIALSESYITQYKSASHRKVRAQFKEWKDAVGKLGRIVASPFQNRLIGDYERLQNANRSLTRHPLYYLADK